MTEVGLRFVTVRFRDGRVAYYGPQQLVAIREEHGARGYACIGPGCELPYGSHLCFLPAADEDPVASPAHFIGQGLLARDRCAVVAPNEWKNRLLERMAGLGYEPAAAIAAGDLLLAQLWEYYYPASEFTADRQIHRLAEWLERFADDTRGLRLLGHVDPVAWGLELGEWWEYEREVTTLTEASGAVTMCSYEGRAAFDPVRRLASVTHQYSLSGGILRSE